MSTLPYFTWYYPYQKFKGVNIQGDPKAKVVVFQKVKKSNLTHKGDDFYGIFVFYNTSIISAGILDVFQICQALINS